MSSMIVRLFRVIATLTLAAAFVPCVRANSQTQAFRTVAFICQAGPDGTVVRTVENILGERILYKITYFDAIATLFNVSRASHGTHFVTARSIDLRGRVQRKDIETARQLAFEMDVAAARFCQGGQRQIEARFELIANHQFNRTNALYRGR